MHKCTHLHMHSQGASSSLLDPHLSQWDRATIKGHGLPSMTPSRPAKLSLCTSKGMATTGHRTGSATPGDSLSEALASTMPGRTQLRSGPQVFSMSPGVADPTVHDSHTRENTWHQGFSGVGLLMLRQPERWWQNVCVHVYKYMCEIHSVSVGPD